MSSNTYILFYISFVFFYLYKVMGSQAPTDTTLGFVSQPLNQSNFEIQKSYDLPIEQRYNFANGVHKLWVFKTDKPHKRFSKTLPRTEIRVRDYDYSSGVWQFEAYAYVPHGTSGVSIMQVFGSKPPYTTTTMLRVYENNLYYYTKHVIFTNIYDKWFRLNVIHDVEGNTVKVYIDGVLRYERPGREGESHYFKFGVYMQSDGSFYMESRWKDIRILKQT
ncbi:hypothetical protein SSX86_032939 [Deinandra increscens subsp. villosa]|uniref:Alginate lyase 2 domain-containing protein n=1 Tax=Deinandra increscens subsp. villosa TaxID=3103831 RepID=A0AAP0C761_9ASTR